MRPRHPKKEVEKALRRAGKSGFEVDVPRSHWGLLRCPGTGEAGCRAHSISSTPRDVDAEAQRIRKYVDKCPHK
jgi:hypothetical protein